MFQFPGYAPRLARYHIAMVGCPIRKSVLDSGYLPLGTAYRSLSRPSSPSRAKASFMCPFLLSFFFYKSGSDSFAFLRCLRLLREPLTGFGLLFLCCVGIELLLRLSVSTFRAVARSLCLDSLICSCLRKDCYLFTTSNMSMYSF